jgi:antitoxin (DNA-binding transcriptional repressor) of toxin-antitoxin stability system
MFVFNRTGYDEVNPRGDATMSTATIEEVQTRLQELLERVAAGEEVVITRDGEAVASLVRPPIRKGVPLIGRGKDQLIRWIEDDEHLADFAEYMP